MAQVSSADKVAMREQRKRNLLGLASTRTYFFIKVLISQAYFQAPHRFYSYARSGDSHASLESRITREQDQALDHGCPLKIARAVILSTSLPIHTRVVTLEDHAAVAVKVLGRFLLEVNILKITFQIYASYYITHQFLTNLNQRAEL